MRKPENVLRHKWHLGTTSVQVRAAVHIWQKAADASTRQALAKTRAKEKLRTNSTCAEK